MKSSSSSSQTSSSRSVSFRAPLQFPLPSSSSSSSSSSSANAMQAQASVAMAQTADLRNAHLSAAQPFAPKVRGKVSQCGNRFKLMAERDGVQVFLGLHETESEAWATFDAHARNLSLVLFDSLFPLRNMAASPSMLTATGKRAREDAREDEKEAPSSEQKEDSAVPVSERERDCATDGENTGASVTSECDDAAPHIPEKLTALETSALVLLRKYEQVRDRLHAATVVRKMLLERHRQAPDMAKSEMLEGLGEEVVFLSLLKKEFEEALQDFAADGAQCVRDALTNNKIS